MQGQSELSLAEVYGPIFDGSNDLRLFRVVHFCATSISMDRPLSFLNHPRIFKKKINKGSGLKKLVRGFYGLTRGAVCECMNGPVPDVFFDILLFCLEF